MADVRLLILCSGKNASITSPVQSFGPAANALRIPSARKDFASQPLSRVVCHRRSLNSYRVRKDALSAVGKSDGTGIVTFPVAAHSVPRWRVTMKPTQFT